MLQDLRTRWIRTGPVEKELQEEIETRFRTLLDHFYQRRKAYFDEQNKIINERLRAYDLLARAAEDLARRTDWDEAFNDLKLMQAEWKVIGKVPPKLLKSTASANTCHKSALHFRQNWSNFDHVVSWFAGFARFSREFAHKP